MNTNDLYCYAFRYVWLERKTYGGVFILKYIFPNSNVKRNERKLNLYKIDSQCLIFTLIFKLRYSKYTDICFTTNAEAQLPFIFCERSAY